MKLKKKQKFAKEWFIKLQNIICHTIEEIEKDYGSNKKFKKNKWKHGEFRTIRGNVIEKGGVAYSNVKGALSKELAKKIQKALVDPNTGKNLEPSTAGLVSVFQKMRKE